MFELHGVLAQLQVMLLGHPSHLAAALFRRFPLGSASRLRALIAEGERSNRPDTTSTAAFTIKAGVLLLYVFLSSSLHFPLNPLRLPAVALLWELSYCLLQVTAQSTILVLIIFSVSFYMLDVFILLHLFSVAPCKSDHSRSSASVSLFP